MQSQMMSGQHSDAETRAQRCVQEAANDRLILLKPKEKRIRRWRNVYQPHKNEHIRKWWSKLCLELMYRRPFWSTRPYEWKHFLQSSFSSTWMCRRHSLKPWASMVTTSLWSSSSCCTSLQKRASMSCSLICSRGQRRSQTFQASRVLKLP